MRIRRLSLGILATVGIAASTLLAPHANAAELTITGDTCTVTLSATDKQRIIAAYSKWGDNLIAELKREVPAAASDIDYIVENVDFTGPDSVEVEAALARVVAASVAKGFFNVDDNPEATQILVIALIIKTDPTMFAQDLTFTRSTIPVDPVDPTDIDPGDGASEPYKRVLQNSMHGGMTAVGEWYGDVYAACRDGEPGTYNVRVTPTGGGGGGGNGGGFGSGGSSFGSS